jgi:hypothetical protein
MKLLVKISSHFVLNRARFRHRDCLNMENI